MARLECGRTPAVGTCLRIRGVVQESPPEIWRERCAGGGGFAAREPVVPRCSSLELRGPKLPRSPVAPTSPS